MVGLDRFDGSCNTIDDPSGRICIRNKTDNVNSNKFNMKTKTNKSKTLIKHNSCNCSCKFLGRKCNLNQKLNNDVSWLYQQKSKK